MTGACGCDKTERKSDWIDAGGYALHFLKADIGSNAARIDTLEAHVNERFYAMEKGLDKTRDPVEVMFEISQKAYQSIAETRAKIGAVRERLDKIEAATVLNSYKTAQLKRAL